MTYPAQRGNISFMSSEATSPRGRLREHVAEEIRVLLARQRISGAELARRTGIKQSTMSRRMTGETAFDMDDLEVIAEVLGVAVADLLPQTASAGPKSLKQTSSSLPRTDDPRTGNHVSTRPYAPGRRDSIRPVSAVPANKRRPTLARPGNRPMAV